MVVGKSLVPWVAFPPSLLRFILREQLYASEITLAVAPLAIVIRLKLKPYVDMLWFWRLESGIGLELELGRGVRVRAEVTA